MWLLRGQDSSADQNDTEKSVADGQTITDLKEQFEQQQQLIQQLKEMLRENEQQVEKKEHELEEAANKLSKVRLQHKAKIADLTNQLKESRSNKSSPEHQQAVVEVSSEASNAGPQRGKIILLKKQLDENRTLFEKREKEMMESQHNIEQVVACLQSQLEERDRMIFELNKVERNASNCREHESNGVNNSSKVGVNELYAQIVYKDSKILELDSKILELERNIIDLQENMKEKDEILSARNQAIHLVTADLSRRNKIALDELDDTRDQMKIMQQNFTALESSWNTEKAQFVEEVESLKLNHNSEISASNSKLQQMGDVIAKLEATRFDLSSRNAQLQEKVIHLQEQLKKMKEIENSDHEAKCKEMQQEIAILKKDLVERKNQTKSSEQKWLKTKAEMTRQIKDLEIQFADLQNAGDSNVKVQKLQQQISVVEEEKNDLRTRLIEMEELMKKQNNDLNAKIRQQNEDLDEHVKMVAVLESTKLDLVDQVLKQRTSLEEAEVNQKRLLEELQKLEDENLNFCDKIASLNQHHNEVMDILEKEKIQIISEWETKSKLWVQTEAGLNEQIINIRSELQLVEEAKRKLNAVLAKKSDEFCKIDDELCELKGFIEERSNEWKSEKDSLNSTIKELEISGIKYESEVQSDLKRLQQLQLDLVKQSEKIDCQNQQLTFAYAEIDKWETTNTENVAQLASLLKKQEIAEAEVKRLEKVAVENEEEFKRIITEKDKILEDAKYNLQRISEEYHVTEKTLQNEIDTLKEELKVSRSEYNSSEIILEEKENLFQELCQQSNQQAEELRIAQLTTTELHDTIRQLQLKYEKQLTEFDMLQKNHEDLQKRVKQLENAIVLQTDELQRLKLELEEANSNCKIITIEKLQLENELELINGKQKLLMKNVDVQINEVIVKSDSLEQRNQEMTEELERLGTESRSLAMLNQSLEKDLGIAVTDKTNVCSELETAKQTIQPLENDLENSFESSKISIEFANQKLLKTNSNLSDELLEARRIVEELKLSITALAQSKDESKGVIRVSELLSATDKELEVSRSENLKFKSEIAALNDEFDESQFVTSKDELERLLNELRKLSPVSDLLNETQQHMQYLKDENQQLLTSVSHLKIELETSEQIKNELTECRLNISELEEQFQSSSTENQELLIVNTELKEKVQEMKLLTTQIESSNFLVKQQQNELNNYFGITEKLQETRAQLQAIVNEKEELMTLNTQLKGSLVDFLNISEELRISRADADCFKEELKSVLERLNQAEKELDIVKCEKQQLFSLNLTLKNDFENVEKVKNESIKKLMEELNTKSAILSDTESRLELALIKEKEQMVINSELKETVNTTQGSLEASNLALEQTRNELKSLINISDSLDIAERRLKESLIRNDELSELNSAFSKDLQDASSLVTELEPYKQRLQQLRSEFNTNAKLLEMLQQQLETFANEKQELLTLNSGLQEELDDAREMVDKLIGDNELMAEKQLELNKLVDDYTNEIARLDLEIQCRRSEVAFHEKEAAQLNIRVEQLVITNNSLSEAVELKESELENLKKSVEQQKLVEIEFQRCSENVSTLKTEISIVNSEGEKLRKMNKRLLEYTQQLETDLESVSTNYRSLEEEKEKLRQELMQANEMYLNLQNDLENKNSSSSNYIDQLKSELCKLNENQEVISERELKFQESLISITNERIELEKHLKNIMEQKGSLEIALNKLQEESEENNSVLRNVIQQLESEKVINKEIRDTNIKLDHEIESSELTIQTLRDQIEILKGNSTEEICLLTEKLAEVYKETKIQKLVLSDELEDQKNKFKILSEKIKTDEVLLEKLQDLADDQLKEFNLEVVVNSIVSLIVNLKFINAELVNQIDQLKSEVHRKQNEMEKDFDLETYRIRCTEYEALNKNYSEEIASFQEQLVHLRDVEKDIIRQQSIINQLNETVRVKEDELKKFDGYIEEIENIQKKLSSRLGKQELNGATPSALSRLIDSICLSEEEKREEVKNIKNQLAESVDEETRLRDEVDALKHQLEVNGRLPSSQIENDEVNELREQNYTLHIRLEETENQLKSHKDDVEKLHLFLKRMKDADDVFTVSFDIPSNNTLFLILKDCFENLLVEKMTLTEQIRQLEKKIKRLEEEKSAIENQRLSLLDNLKSATTSFEGERQNFARLQIEYEKQIQENKADVEQLVDKQRRIPLEAIQGDYCSRNSEIVTDEHLLTSSLETPERADSPQEMKKANAVLKIKNEKMMIRLKMFKDKNDKLQMQINDLMTERNRLEDQHVRMSEHNQWTKDEIYRLSMELRNVERLWKTETQLLKDRLDTVEIANSKLVDIKEDLERKLTSEIQLGSDLNNEKIQLKQLLNEREYTPSSRHSELEVKYDQLEKKLNNEFEHNKCLEIDLQQHQKLIEKLQNEKESMSSRNDRYNSLYTECIHLKEDLLRLKLNFQETFESDDFKLKEIGVEVENLQNRLALSVEANEVLQKQVNNFKETLLSTAETYSFLSEDTLLNDDLSVAFKSFLKKIVKEVDHLKLDLNSNSENVEELNRRVSELEVQKTNLEIKNSQLQEETKTYADEINKFMTCNAQLIQDIQKLQTSLETISLEKVDVELKFKDVIGKQNEVIENLQNKLLIESDRDIQLQSEIDILRRRFDNLQNVNDTINSEAMSLKDENESLKFQDVSFNNDKKLTEEHSYVNLAEYPYRINDRKISQLEVELQLAVNSLHTRDLRCEELTDELTDLIKERDSLQIRLSTLLRADQQKEIQIQMLEREVSLKSPNQFNVYTDSDESNFADQKMLSVAELNSRLKNTETHRQELLQMNAALSEALTNERDARLKLAADLKFVEAELESCWKRKHQKEIKLDISDSKGSLLPDNAQIIERTYTGTTWRIVNWFQGRSLPRVMHV